MMATSMGPNFTGHGGAMNHPAMGVHPGMAPGMPQNQGQGGAPGGGMPQHYAGHMGAPGAAGHPGMMGGMPPGGMTPQQAQAMQQQMFIQQQQQQQQQQQAAAQQQQFANNPAALARMQQHQQQLMHAQQQRQQAMMQQYQRQHGAQTPMGMQGMVSQGQLAALRAQGGFGPQHGNPQQHQQLIAQQMAMQQQQQLQQQQQAAHAQAQAAQQQHAQAQAQAQAHQAQQGGQPGQQGGQPGQQMGGQPGQGQQMGPGMANMQQQGQMGGPGQGQMGGQQGPQGQPGQQPQAGPQQQGTPQQGPQSQPTPQQGQQSQPSQQGSQAGTPAPTGAQTPSQAPAPSPAQSQQQQAPGQNQAQQQAGQQQAQGQQPAQQQAGPGQQAQMQAAQMNAQQQMALQNQLLQQQRQREGMKSHCMLKLMQFAEHLSSYPGRKDKDDLSYWNAFAYRFFSPNGVFRHTPGVADPEEGPKQYDISFAHIPRYFHTQFESGVRNIQLVLERNTLDRALPGDGQLLENPRASFIYWFDTGSHLVTTGNLRAQYDAEQKLELFEFVTLESEEYVARKQVIEAAKPAHMWMKEWHRVNASDAKSSPEMSKKGKGKQLKSPQSLPPEVLNDLPDSAVMREGVTKAVHQFLELTEVMNHMNPLMQFCNANPEFGPYAALDQYVNSLANGQNPNMPNGQHGGMPQQPQTPSFGQFPMGASPAAAHMNLPGAAGSPHVGASPIPGPMQAPAMQMQQSQQGTSSSGPSANTSPASNNKRRRPSTVKLEDDGSGAPTPQGSGPHMNGRAKPPTPRMQANKRQKQT